MIQPVFQIDANLKQLTAMRDLVEERASVFNVGPDAMHDVLLAVTEMVTNIILHGYRQQPGTIEIEVRPEGDALVVQLRDEAPLFDPTTLPAPDITLPLDSRPVGGLGVYMTKKLMDDVSYRVTSQGKNELTLVKNHAIPIA